MISVNECPVCKGTSFKLITQCKDYTVSHETFPVKQCTTCTLGITDNRPEDGELAKYYLSENYISHSGKSHGIIGSIYKAARNWSLRWKWALINKHSTPGKVLDFGCGTGEFLHTLQKKGWSIDGVEPSPLARKKAEELNRKMIHESINSATGSYKIITAWHVIEHVPDLNGIITELKNKLEPGGTIFVAVPNYQAPDSIHYKNYWAGYDTPRHLWHFSNKSMRELLKLHGLTLKETIPMKLDAYYVSLLSEKYKNHKASNIATLIKGFVNGLKSNLRASATNNYSSLIYIATNDES